MTDIFKQLAPRWRRVVRDYALTIWKQKDTPKTFEKFNTQAGLFALRYKRELQDYYKRKEINVYRGTIDGKVNDWLARQNATVDTLKVIALAKKDKLIGDEFAKLASQQGADVQKTLNKIYDVKAGENVYRAFSFGENFEARAEQIGEENAFELGREINEAVLSQDSELYLWENQHDNRVRETHKNAPKGLGGLVFLFSDPPTTITAGGVSHTGNPGTDWGCRCFADIAPKGAKPKRRYTVTEKKSKKR